MATQEDDRIEEITSETVYGLHHHDNLIYIGSTCRPLSRRLQEHKKEASRRSTPLYEYLENEVDHFGNVSISELPQDSEEEALEDWGWNTLNAQVAEDTEYQGPDWTSAMVDVLEDSDSAAEAAERLSIPYHHAYDAMVELDLIDGHDYNGSIDWEKWDGELGTMPDAELADRIGCSQAAVSHRRQQLGIDAHGPTGLSDEQVMQIWVQYHLDEDQTYAEVADKMPFDASWQQVGNVVRRDAYTDVDVPSKTAIKAAQAYAEVGEDDDR